MSKNWTDKLPDLFEGYEEVAPEGLWDAVLAEIKPKRRVLPIFWWASAALATAAAVVLAVFLWKPAQPTVSEPGTVPSAAQPILADIPETTAEPISTPEYTPESIPEITPHILPVTVPEDAPEYLTYEPLAIPAIVVEQAAKKQEVKPSPVLHTVPLIKQEKPRHRPRIGISVRSGGYLAQAASSVSTGYGVPYNLGIQTKSVNGGDPTIAMLSRNRASTTTETHRPGNRIGLGLSYEFLPRWSLESGVSYTSLLSAYNTTSGLSVSDATRTVKYIGIPMNVQFRLLDKKRLCIYLSAGPMLETAVGGSVSTTSYISGKRSSEQYEPLDLNDLQWSFGSGAGVQLGISRHGALFAQPGFSWHFAGSGNVESYYTAHPFSWDLALGYRLTL